MAKRADILAAARRWGPLAGVAVVGLAVRLWMMSQSAGSNDIVLWKGFAANVRRFGLIWTYQNVRIFNHPPLPAYFGRAMLAMPGRFEVTFKLLALAGDLLAGALVYLTWRPRGVAPALRATGFLAVSLISVLVTAHHGNTDPLVVALVLLSAYLFERDRFLGAGLALGAALNVKLIPGPLLPLFLLQCRRWRDLGRFGAGLAVCALPFVPVVVLAGPAFFRNAIAYNSNPHRWGLGALLELTSLTPHVQEYAKPLHTAFREHGRYLMLLAIAAIAAVGRWRPRWTMTELATLGLLCFLVLAPGFGPQYAVYAVPMLLAVRPVRGFIYSTVGGLFLLVLYLETWTGERPWYSHFVTHFSMGAVVIGVVAWTLLIESGAAILKKS